MLQAKYACWSAPLAEIRALGLYRMSCSSNSTPVCPNCARVLRMFSHPFGFHLGKVDLKSGNSESPGHMASVGVPNFWKILKAVSISESPAKRENLLPSLPGYIQRPTCQLEGYITSSPTESLVACTTQ